MKWRCTVCGYVHEGDPAPDTCPVCGAGKEAFVIMEDPSEKQGAAKEEKEDAQKEETWVCGVCGYLHKGETPPDTCPVCAAGKAAFTPYPETGENVPQDPPQTADPQATPMAPEEEVPTEDPAPSDGVHPYIPLMDALIKEHHAHPISVHFPNGVIPVAVFFFLMGALFPASSFSLAAYFNLTMVFLALPLVLYTGYVEWRDNYRMALTPVFKIKIGCAAATTACVSILVIWRSFSPDAGGILYALLHIVALITTGVAGHYGGKLVFQKKG